MAETPRVPLVLVVEDDAGVAGAEEAALRLSGFRVQIASCAAQALEKDFNAYDAIILDYHLPDLAGTDLLDEIRGRSDVPVIFVTVEEDLGVVMTALARGATDYLLKRTTFTTEVPIAVGRAIEARKVRVELDALRKGIAGPVRSADYVHILRGLIHDLNNPLGGILGYTQLLLLDETLPPAVTEDVKHIRELAERCTSLSKLITVYALPLAANRAPVHLDAIIEDALRLLRRDMLSIGVTVDKRFGDTRPLAISDPQGLSQVVIAVLRHASHSLMGVDGARRITISAEAKDDHAILTIEDTSPDRRGDDQMPALLTAAAGIARNLGGTVEVTRGPAGARTLLRIPARATSTVS